MAATPSPTDTKPRRRWRQYSLRTLLVLVLLASVGMSWLAVQMAAARRQQEVVAEIEKYGGDVWYDDELVPSNYQGLVPVDYRKLVPPQSVPPLNEPGFSAPPWLRKLFGDDFFRTVIAVHPKCELDLPSVVQLPGLRRLVLSSGTGRRCALDSAQLHGPCGRNAEAARRVRDAWNQLAELTNLEELNLSGSDVEDDDLEILETTPRLRCLELDITRITGEGLRHLEGLTQLEILVVSSTKVGDDGVAHLEGLTRLWYLDLSHTRITDATLEQVAGWKHLKFLNVRGTDITVEGMKKIYRALPECKIVALILVPEGEDTDLE